MDDRHTESAGLERSLEERFAALSPTPVPDVLVARVRRRRWARRGRIAGIGAAAVLAFVGGVMLRGVAERSIVPSPGPIIAAVPSIEALIGPTPVRRASLADSTEPALRVLDRSRLLEAGL
jgi:hypothetical protein